MPPVVAPRTRTNTKTLASMVANDIEPDVGSVSAALQETNLDDRRHAIARIATTLASPIRTKTAQAIATSTLAAGTDAATIVAIARALVPPEFLKAAKAGQIQQNPAMQVIDALVRAARDLVLPPEHQDYLILIRPLHLRQAQEIVPSALPFPPEFSYPSLCGTCLPRPSCILPNPPPWS